jgi:hypothetical protein
MRDNGNANIKIFIGSQVVQVRLHFCTMSNHSATPPYTNTIVLIECLRTEQMKMSSDGVTKEIVSWYWRYANCRGSHILPCHQQKFGNWVTFADMSIAI